MTSVSALHQWRLFSTFWKTLRKARLDVNSSSGTGPWYFQAGTHSREIGRGGGKESKALKPSRGWSPFYSRSLPVLDLHQSHSIALEFLKSH